MSKLKELVKHNLLCESNAVEDPANWGWQSAGAFTAVHDEIVRMEAELEALRRVAKAALAWYERPSSNEYENRLRLWDELRALPAPLREELLAEDASDG